MQHDVPLGTFFFIQVPAVLDNAAQCGWWNMRAQPPHRDGIAIAQDALGHIRAVGAQIQRGGIAVPKVAGKPNWHLSACVHGPT